MRVKSWSRRKQHSKWIKGRPDPKRYQNTHSFQLMVPLGPEVSHTEQGMRRTWHRESSSRLWGDVVRCTGRSQGKQGAAEAWKAALTQTAGTGRFLGGPRQNVVTHGPSLELGVPTQSSSGLSTAGTRAQPPPQPLPTCPSSATCLTLIGPGRPRPLQRRSGAAGSPPAGNGRLPGGQVGELGVDVAKGGGKRGWGPRWLQVRGEVAGGKHGLKK